MFLVIPPEAAYILWHVFTTFVTLLYSRGGLIRISDSIRIPAEPFWMSGGI